MKTKITLPIIALLLSFSAFATVRTVSNDPNNPAQYSGIQAAITAANAGDTIYVEPTTVFIQNGAVQNVGSNYGAITINKRIVLMGSGYNPTKDYAYISTLSSISFDTSSAVGSVSGASGAVVSGFYIYGSITTSSNYNVAARANNITVQRCWITSSITLPNCNNTTIQQCVIQGASYYGNNTNIALKNNIINAQIYANWEGSSPVNFVIANNDFIGYTTSGSTAAYSAFNSSGAILSNALIANNIFYAVDPTGAINSTFNNNITFADPNDNLPYGNNVGTGNQVGVNPTFVNYPTASANYSVTYDFHLAAGSPGAGAGTDKTDVGIYGGIGFVPTGAPNIPYIEHFVISNSYISPGQNLNVSIEAKAQK